MRNRKTDRTNPTRSPEDEDVAWRVSRERQEQSKGGGRKGDNRTGRLAKPIERQNKTRKEGASEKLAPLAAEGG